MAVNVTIQQTPNPNARRFLLDKAVQSESRGRFFTDSSEADDPLAQALLGQEGVVGVMLLPNSATVTKADSAQWAQVEEATRQALEAYFA